MARRLLGLALAACLVGAFAAPHAMADDLSVSVALNSTGGRTLAVLDTPSLGTVDLNSATSVADVVIAAVTETLANGVNPWSVTTQLCGADDGDGGTAGFQASIDCTENHLTRGDGDGGSEGSVIAGSRLSVANSGASAAVALPLGGSTTFPGGTLGSVRDIIRTTGQSAATLYTGTYTFNGPLSIDLTDFTETGTYYGFLRVTLVD
jgi:hypothetical protein